MLRRAHAHPRRSNQIRLSKGLLNIQFFFFFRPNTRCFLLIPLSMIFGVQILETLCRNLNFVEVQNLNRILRFDFYTHSDGHSMPQNAIAKQQVPRAIFVSLIARYRRWG